MDSNVLEDLAKKGFEISIYKAFPNQIVYEAYYNRNSVTAVRFVERDVNILVAECDLFLEGI